MFKKRLLIAGIIALLAMASVASECRHHSTPEDKMNRVIEYLTDDMNLTGEQVELLDKLTADLIIEFKDVHTAKQGAHDIIITQIESDVMGDRDQLLLDVSHELRTPLTRMKVPLEFLPDGRAKSTLGEDIVEMEDMVTAILNEARLRHGKIVRQPVDLSSLLQEVISEFKNRQPAVETRFDKKPVLVDAAPELIRMVFRNIIDNALKHSEPDTAPVNVRIEQAGAETVVSVSDHGSGIAKDELSRIFEPFYRVDKSRSRDTDGYGIGLSFCKTIMDAHGGRIDIESEPDKGTIMRIRFFKEPDKIIT